MHSARLKSWGLGAASLGAALAVVALLSGEALSLARAARRLTGAPDAPLLAVPLAPPSASPAADGTPKAAAEARARIRALERTWHLGGPGKPAQLAAAGGWMRALAVHAALPPAGGPAAELAQLQATLAVAADPVARQNLIFLGVLTLPPDVSHPWLRALAAGSSAADAEDALVALAFDGDAEARAGFARLAETRSPAPVHRLLDDCYAHEELGRTASDEAREVLRSYRAIEVLDRVPYFKITFHFVRHAPWRPHPARTPDLDRELLAEWVARYPGHPGGDDMALRLGRLATARGAHVEAARWYGRAVTLPDQDVVDEAASDLVATCELLLTPEELDGLAHEQGYLTPNRTLLQYIRLRRLAAERGFDVATWYAAALGRDEPQSLLGYAWNHRRATLEPRGLRSGLVPLTADDLLRGRDPRPPSFPRAEGAPDITALPGLWVRPKDAKARLYPWPERVQIWELGVMRQLRAWEALAALEQRAAQAAGDARADLLYKEAAIFFHDPRVLYPAYASARDYRKLFATVTGTRTCARPASFGAYVRTSYSLLRAIRLFERIERDHPDYAGLDRVIFSEGLAWKELLDWKCDAVEGGYGCVKEDPYPRRTKIRLATTTLERCAATFPQSPLADDALRAAAYWRRTEPNAFE